MREGWERREEKSEGGEGGGERRQEERRQEERKGGREGGSLFPRLHLFNTLKWKSSEMWRRSNLIHDIR